LPEQIVELLAATVGVAFTIRVLTEVLEPVAFLAIKATVYVPAFAKVTVGFCALIFENVTPVEEVAVHVQDVGAFNDWSVSWVLIPVQDLILLPLRLVIDNNQQPYFLKRCKMTGFRDARE
jgi:hypothetical protein